jgi:RNA polymerase sigma factor (sigma-70 family)
MRATRGELQWIEADGTAAREEMIRRSLDLVEKEVVLRHVGNVPREDLLQAGAVGLLEAVDKYNFMATQTFRAHAPRFIRRSIRDALVTQGWTICVPARLVTKFDRTARNEPVAFEPDGAKPSHVRLADALAFTDKEVRELLALPEVVCSTDALADIAPDFMLGPVPASVPSSAVREAWVRELSHRARYVIRRRFTDLSRVWSYDDIGRRLALTSQQVRYIEHTALRDLRVLLQSPAAAVDVW